MVRWLALLAVGVVVSAGVVPAACSPATAATPALHVEPGSTWKAEPYIGGCELEIFSANGTFASQFDGAAGRWSGGGETIRMSWTRRTKGLTFGGTFNPSVHGHPAYLGRFRIEGYVFEGRLIKGTRC
jgi:hypothetical protein